MRRLGRGRRAPEAELLQLLEVEATQEHRPGAATVLSLTNLCGHDLVGLSQVVKHPSPLIIVLGLSNVRCVATLQSHPGHGPASVRDDTYRLYSILVARRARFALPSRAQFRQI